MAYLGLLENVEPERCLAVPTHLIQAHLVPGKWFDAHCSRNSFSRWQVERLPSHKVTIGQRVLFGNCCFPNHRLRQIDKRVSENSIDALAGLWWSPVIYIEEVRPVHYSTMWNRDCASAV